MCGCDSSKKRGKRDQLWYLSSSYISITFGPSSPLHSLHISPTPSSPSSPSLVFWLSQENYILTVHFNISVSKWVWQALLFVPLPFTVPTSIRALLSLRLSFPAPSSSCRVPIVTQTVQPLPCDRSEAGRVGEMEKKNNKNKSGSKWGRFAGLSGCLSVSPCEFCDTYTSMNLRWGEVSLRPDVCHSCSAFDAHRQRFRLTGRGSDLIHRDRQKRGLLMSLYPLLVEPQDSSATALIQKKKNKK